MGPFRQLGHLSGQSLRVPLRDTCLLILGPLTGALLLLGGWTASAQQLEATGRALDGGLGWLVVVLLGLVGMGIGLLAAGSALVVQDRPRGRG